MVFALGIGTAAFAQDVRTGGMGMFMVGSQGIEADQLNDWLDDNGYSRTSQSLSLIGGGGLYIGEDVVIGGHGAGFLRQNLDGDNVSSTAYLSGGYGMFDLGIPVYRSPDLMIYPMLSIGGGSISVHEENITSTLSDSDSSGKSVGGLLYQLSVGADYLIGGTSCGQEESCGGISVGFRAGYTLPANQDDWQLSLTGRPKAVISGPFFMLTVGGWGLGG